MRRHRGERLLGVRLRSARLEPQDPVREHFAERELASHLVLDGAEVFADHVGLGAHAFERDDPEQIERRVADVDPFSRVFSARDPKQAEEPHHVIEPHPAHVTHRRSNDAHDGFVPTAAQFPRFERQEAPFLTLRIELVGGSAHFHAFGEELLPNPTVGAAGIDPHRGIADQAVRSAGFPELLVQEPLQPLVKAHALGVRGAKTFDLGTTRVTKPSGPSVPVVAVGFGEHRERRERLEQRGLFRAVRVEVGRASKSAEQRAQGLHFQLENRVAIDARLLREQGACSGQRRDDGAECARAWHLFDAQVQRITKDAAARIIRARLLRQRGERRMQRVHEDHPRAEFLLRPARELTQIGEVSHAPTSARTEGIELHGPAPGR